VQRHELPGEVDQVNRLDPLEEATEVDRNSAADLLLLDVDRDVAEAVESLNNGVDVSALQRARHDLSFFVSDFVAEKRHGSPVSGLG